MKIESGPREDHLLGVEPLFFRQTLILAAKLIAKDHGILDQNIGLRTAEFLFQFP